MPTICSALCRGRDTSRQELGTVFALNTSQRVKAKKATHLCEPKLTMNTAKIYTLEYALSLSPNGIPFGKLIFLQVKLRWNKEWQTENNLLLTFRAEPIQVSFHLASLEPIKQDRFAKESLIPEGKERRGNRRLCCRARSPDRLCAGLFNRVSGRTQSSRGTSAAGRHPGSGSNCHAQSLPAVHCRHLESWIACHAQCFPTQPAGGSSKCRVVVQRTPVWRSRSRASAWGSKPPSETGLSTKEKEKVRLYLIAQILFLFPRDCSWALGVRNLNISQWKKNASKPHHKVEY